MVNLTTEELLSKLKEERDKFTGSNKLTVRSIVCELIHRGHYPAETVPGNPNDVYTMVECWGVHWNQWGPNNTCPHCKADLRDHQAGPPFGRVIGLSNGDRVTLWCCPDCKGTWPRET